MKPELIRGLPALDALVVGVSDALSLVEDRAEDTEVLDLQGPLLCLHEVPEAFGNATPDHVEQSHCFSLSRFKRSLRVLLCQCFLSLW